MSNIKITIEYDGKNFAGWQSQPGKVSIQSEIEKAIKERRKDELPQKYEKAFSYAFMDKDKSASNEEDIVANCTDIYYEQIEL